MNMSGRIPEGLTSLFRLVPLVAGCLLLLTFAEGRAQPTGAGDASTVRGKVERFTTAPMGETDGAVLDDGTWLHWPPHMQDRFANIFSTGDQVRATGRTETGPAGDTHFEVQSVTNLRTNTIADNPDYANGPPPPPPGRRGRAAPPPAPPGPNRLPTRTDDTDVSTVRGRVDRLTSAPRGETDGAVLDDGTWLHWPPHMQDRFANIFSTGDQVRATGRTETGPAGDTHFEVQSVTNLRTNAMAENPDFASGPLSPLPGRGVAIGRPADREQRLRDLEEQVDRLLQEIQRLRRER